MAATSSRITIHLWGTIQFESDGYDSGIPRHVASLDYYEATKYGAVLLAPQLRPLAWGATPKAWSELGRARRAWLRLRWLVLSRPWLRFLTWRRRMR